MDDFPHIEADGQRTWLHIYPMHDLRPHLVEGGECWCHPEIDDDVVIHNSLDGRENIVWN